MHWVLTASKGEVFDVPCHSDFSISTKLYLQPYPGIRSLGFWSVCTSSLFSCTRKGCTETDLWFFRFFVFDSFYNFPYGTKETLNPRLQYLLFVYTIQSQLKLTSVLMEYYSEL